jgi:hypothetical protein
MKPNLKQLHHGYVGVGTGSTDSQLGDVNQPGPVGAAEMRIGRHAGLDAKVPVPRKEPFALRQLTVIAAEPATGFAAACHEYRMYGRDISPSLKDRPMPFPRIPAWVKAIAAWLHATLATCVNATQQSFQNFIDWMVRNARRLGEAIERRLETCRNYINAAIEGIAAWVVAAKNWEANQRPIAVAYVRRYGHVSFYVLALVVIAALGWIFWQYHVVSDLLKVDSKDTPHANDYYAVNVLVLPMQTVLLLVASVYGAWTLNQNRKFKQHDVEATCVRDYVAIEDRLANTTGDGAKTVAAVRAYWTLMVYEYYWWRRGLISRGLFTIWCEFRVQRFRGNPDYTFTPDTFGAGQQPPFTKYKGGFEFCKTSKVFRSPSAFEDLMRYLIDRATNNLDNLQWYEIERFRHKWHQGF